jgi:CoA:oxalate CoA-transferase
MSATLLSGIKVLDLTNVLAGPFCAYQLAMLGAEVLKVETPGSGDLARQLGADPELSASTWAPPSWPRTAASLADAQPEARGRQGVCSRLVEDADVLVENFRPGVMDRLGLGYDELKAVNPRWSTAPSPASARTARCAPRRPTTRSSRACPA